MLFFLVEYSFDHKLYPLREMCIQSKAVHHKQGECVHEANSLRRCIYNLFHMEGYWLSFSMYNINNYTMSDFVLLERSLIIMSNTPKLTMIVCGIKHAKNVKKMIDEFYQMDCDIITE